MICPTIAMPDLPELRGAEREDQRLCWTFGSAGAASSMKGNSFTHYTAGICWSCGEVITNWEAWPPRSREVCWLVRDGLEWYSEAYWAELRRVHAEGLRGYAQVWRFQTCSCLQSVWSTCGSTSRGPSYRMCLNVVTGRLSPRPSHRNHARIWTTSWNWKHQVNLKTTR